jgi:predicted NAD/FAD-binding protein
VIGAGISGLSAARDLSRDHNVTVFEADARLGGHANTVEVEVDGAPVVVDTGFIVFNERNYPGFLTMLTELGVAHHAAPMSFSVTDGAALEYSITSTNSVFANRANALRPGFLRMLLQVRRFNDDLAALVAGEPRWTGADRLPARGADGAPAASGEPTLAAVVAAGGYSREFVAGFLVPFGSAIWSADPRAFLDFPARSYARFMANHGLLVGRGTRQWRTVTGGSREYVRALTAPLSDHIHTSTPVRSVTALGGEIEVALDSGPLRFDRVVIATHSDQALHMLTAPTRAQRDVLGAIAYQPNSATLHTDASLMPRRRLAWAPWNSRIRPGPADRATLTYWMNDLQSLIVPRPLLVTMNLRDAIDPNQVLGEYSYAHPVFDTAALAAQRRRHAIQGAGGIAFAGAYLGYGFHEDGVQAGLEAARAIRGDAGIGAGAGAGP